MRSPIVLAAAAALLLLAMFPPAIAQGVDPGIAAIVAALKATLTTTLVPASTNGWSPKLANGLSTTVVSVKNAAGELGSYHCVNQSGAVAYVQVFDAPTAGSVTLGSTTPVLSFGLPAASSLPGGGNLEWSNGIHFANGIQVAATTTSTGSSAPSTAVDCNFAYK
jgi:hypothetical protein